MSEYIILETETFGSISTVIKKTDGELVSYIPTDPANSDYQRYLRWLENPDAEENGGL